MGGGVSIFFAADGGRRSLHLSLHKPANLSQNPSGNDHHHGSPLKLPHQLTHLGALEVQLYRLADEATGGLLLFMVVFGPWAFGTTQPWAVTVMNFTEALLGGLLVTKLLIRKVKNYPAPRWDSLVLVDEIKRPRSAARTAIKALGWLTFALLLFCCLSALNAAATYSPEKHFFTYHKHQNWLPHSFDSTRSWAYFRLYLGLAAAFWSARDWLLGRTAAEERILRHQAEPGVPTMPARLRRLLWVLAVSGTLLGVEAITQRVADSSKLLFVVQPVVNQAGDTQFGTYAYRSNAAQYFNLLWPVCLGVWWLLRHKGRRHTYFFAIAAIVMGACPIISTSRAGAIVAVGMLAVAGILLVSSELRTMARHGASRRRWKNLVFTIIFLVGASGLGFYFGWEKLAPRMDEIGGGYANREQMYADARPMAADYPVFGTGPGTFATVFQLYRISNTTYWPEQLHNDWLETLITFGWTGLLLAMAALGCVAVLGLFAPRRMALVCGLALTGCLVHAYFDFPLQVHSILFLFLLLAAILAALGTMARKH